MHEGLRSIKIGEHTVTKMAAPELMRIEVEKSERAATIGKNSGLFRVPNILNYDESNGIIVYEKLDISPVSKAVRWGKEHIRLATHLGACLAVIHAELQLPSEMTIPLPIDLDFPGNEVFIHGDFNIANICLEKEWPSLVIIDWQMTAVHGGRATYGSRYFDLMWYVNSLLWNLTIHHLVRDPVAAVAKVFIESYFKEAGLAINAEDLHTYAERFFSSKRPLRNKQGSKAFHLLFARCDLLTSRFITSLRRGA